MTAAAIQSCHHGKSDMSKQQKEEWNTYRLSPAPILCHYATCSSRLPYMFSINPLSLTYVPRCVIPILRVTP